MGIIFQIRDDIFDYYDSKEIGKPTGNDMVEGKLTLPVIYALKSTGDEAMMKLARKVKAHTVTADEIAQLVAFTKANGGIEDAILRKKRVYFPKSYGEDCHMEFYQVISVKQLEAGYKGIREPAADESLRYRFRTQEDTLMILPGVAFGTDGYRIGYGKGFYDRYLQDKAQITRMGLAFSNQITEPFIHEEHDRKMDKIVK